MGALQKTDLGDQALFILGTEQDFLNAFTAMKGALARGDRAWIRRATTSLPLPAGPEIRTRLFVGPTRSISWRNCEMAPDLPISSGSPGPRALSSAFSRRNWLASMARSIVRISLSLLKGFSMKS